MVNCFSFLSGEVLSHRRRMSFTDLRGVSFEPILMPGLVIGVKKYNTPRSQNDGGFPNVRLSAHRSLSPCNTIGWNKLEAKWSGTQWFTQIWDCYLAFDQLSDGLSRICGVESLSEMLRFKPSLTIMRVRTTDGSISSLDQLFLLPSMELDPRSTRDRITEEADLKRKKTVIRLLMLP